MKKQIATIVILGAFSLGLGGCAAVVDGAAYLNGKQAADHPAIKTAVVNMPKNSVFNSALRALTAKDRKVTSSDREAGIIQGQINGNDVMIRIEAKGNNQAALDMTVTYSQTLAFGKIDVDGDLNTLWAEIVKN